MRLAIVLANLALYVYMRKPGTRCLSVAFPFTFAKTSQPVAAVAHIVAALISDESIITKKQDP